MVVKDLRNSFNPVPKAKKENVKSTNSKEEFCIMPKNKLYKTERENGLARHEVFFGTANRKLSIEDGLIVFLTHENHNLGDKCVHKNKGFDMELKKIGQMAWMKYYKKTKKEFKERYGKNYL